MHLFLPFSLRAVALLAPDRVAGLVVLDIAPVRYTTAEPHWQAVQHILQTLAQASTALPPTTPVAEVETYLRQQGVTDPAVRAFVLTNYKQNGGWKVPVELLERELEALAGFLDEQSETTDDDSSLVWSGDAFFIHGGQSRFVRSAHLETIGRYFPHHMLTTIRGAGHWIHAEAPEDTTALLQQYLDRGAARRGR